ncbi:MAG: Lrp/AsnC family transcriptional regulator, partial [Nanoarchaeota archaeon]|nr:Lrp/AsnC family transcriptional regulator [Nanoarchaeota archaeon]
GFISFREYLKLQNTDPQKEAEIIQFLKEQKAVTWLVSIDGEYDIGMWIATISIKEMNNIWKEILDKYVNYIDKRWLTVFTRVSYFPRAYLIEKKQNLEEYVFITEPEDIDLDQKDIELIKLLAPDARISILELAKRLKITPKTVASRIKELEAKKVIIGYRTMFDLEKLGYQYFKLHINLHNTSQERIKNFGGYVKSHPNIIFDNEVLGGDDLEIEIQATSLQHFRDIVDDIKKRFSEIIKNHRYMLFYKEHKFLFFPS